MMFWTTTVHYDVCHADAMMIEDRGECRGSNLHFSLNEWQARTRTENEI
jgi:hypothetical protein